MTARQNEKRKFKRIPFPITEKIEAVCRAAGNNTVKMYIANLSEGGIGLIAKKELIKTISVNDILILNQIIGIFDLGFVRNLELEVKWLLEPKNMENAGIGCSFNNISDSVKEKLITFINSMEVVAD